MNSRFARLSALLPLLFAPVLHAQQTDTKQPADASPQNNVLWDVSNGGGIVGNYGQLTLGISKGVSATASVTQASDGTQGYSAGLNRNTETGWLGVNYKTISVSNDFSTQTFTLYTGRIVDKWDFSFSPSYIRTSVYGQKGSKQSNTIGAPGLSLGLAHHGKKMDVGLNGGMNFYSSNLDSYITDSRKIDNVGLQTQLTTTGLEKSYWSVYMRRYQSWGDWGLDYLDSISAVDASHNQSTAARLTYYLNRQWDLRFALIQANYSGVSQNNISIGARYYW